MRTDHGILYLLLRQQLQKNDTKVENLPWRPNEIVWNAFISGFLLIVMNHTDFRFFFGKDIWVITTPGILFLLFILVAC